MADKVREIFNGEIQYGDFDTTLLTKNIVTSNASTQYVVRDVYVDNNQYHTSPTLQVNGFDVGELTGTLSGTEIVDVNSKLDVKRLYGLINVQGVVFASNSTYYHLTSEHGVWDYLYKLNGPYKAHTGIPPVTMGNNLFKTSIHQMWQVGNDVYYFDRGNDHDNRSFVKRAGGIEGGSDQYILNNDPHWQITYDGERYFYGVINSSIRRLDTQSASPSFDHLFNGHHNGNTENVVDASNLTNGKFAYRPNGTNAEILIVDVNLQKYVRFSIPTTTVGSGYHQLFLYYDVESETYYLLYSPDDTSMVITFYDVDFNNANNTDTISRTLLRTDGEGFAGSRSNYPIPLENGYFLVRAGGMLKLIDPMANLIDEAPFPFLDNRGAFLDVRVEKDIPTEELNTYGPSINIRITGIETTS